MAAYMRKAGILPVCTNNEARAYFAGKGLTYADVAAEQAHQEGE